MTRKFLMVDADKWGYKTPQINPIKIVEKLVKETKIALDEWEALPDKQSCDDDPRFDRVFINIPISKHKQLYNQFFNGCSGYRAHYYRGEEIGEYFNKLLVENIAPIIVESKMLYEDKFTPEFCQMSLCGRYSKFWFSKDITDPSKEKYLSKLPEVI